MSHTIDLAGQRALVTGANSGIGEGIAYALAEAGAAVVVSYNSSPERAQKVVGRIREKGGQAIAIRANVEFDKALGGLWVRCEQRRQRHLRSWNRFG